MALLWPPTRNCYDLFQLVLEAGAFVRVNSILCVSILYLVFFFLTYFTLYNRLHFIHLIRTDSNVFFLMAE